MNTATSATTKEQVLHRVIEQLNNNNNNNLHHMMACQNVLFQGRSSQPIT